LNPVFGLTQFYYPEQGFEVKGLGKI